MNTNYRKWFRNCIIVLASILTGIFLVVLVVDPFFHYHGPLMKYRLIEPRYTNDGISRHFDYDAVITGTSMAQNFKTSQFEELFGVTAVKMPFSGAGYEEIADNMARTLSRNPDISKVLWAVDYNGLLRKPDWSQYSEYPTYLYDNNILNDAPYVFNKSMLYHSLLSDVILTLKDGESTTMDEYTSFDNPRGAANIYLSRHTYTPAPSEHLTEAEIAQVRDTFQTNFIDIINRYPDTTFYLYLTPYSIFNWEYLDGCGQIERYIEAQTIATEMFLECPNVELSTFFEETDIICNLDNYTDEAHYTPEISEMIMNSIASKDHLVTKENYRERIAAQTDFFLNFDYDTYFTNLEKEIAKTREDNN